jgi:hypothetical protein
MWRIASLLGMMDDVNEIMSSIINPLAFHINPGKKD